MLGWRIAHTVVVAVGVGAAMYVAPAPIPPILGVGLAVSLLIVWWPTKREREARRLRSPRGKIRED